MAGVDDQNYFFELPLGRGEIFYYLRGRSSKDHEELLGRVRLQRGDGPTQVRALGMITVSTHCVRDCVYCVLSTDYPERKRFRLTIRELMKAATRAAEAGIKTLLLKSGDDRGLAPEAVIEMIHAIRSELPLELILSLGERKRETLSAWGRAGAAAYWIRHDTCDPHIYRRIRPSMYGVDRIRMIGAIKQSGLKLGVGLMIGVPNQDHESVVEDLIFLGDPAIESAVIEPFLPPADSKGKLLVQKPENMIVSPDPMTMEKIFALIRLLKPKALIPLTRQYAELYQALENPYLFLAGANALIIDFTPGAAYDKSALPIFSGLLHETRQDMEDLKQKLKNSDVELTF